MFISVVIPIYNKRKSIRRTVNSVLKQVYDNFELIIIDDGSTDGSFEEISDINDIRLKRFQKENSGVSATRNLGMKMAQGDIVAFLDGDDIWDAYYLKRLNDMYHLYPDCAMFFQTNKIVPYDEVDESLGTSDKEMPIIRSTNWEKHFYYRNFYTSSIAVNKEKALLLGGFDTSLTIGEDLDLWLRLMLSYPLCFLDEVHVSIVRYESDYHSRFVPKDYKRHLSYKLIKERELYLRIKDNRDVRRIMNKMMFYAWMDFTKDNNWEAVFLLKHQVSYKLLFFKDKIKYILFRLHLWN